jgi:hypothetical protein
VQYYYMRQERGLCMGLDTSVKKIVERVNDLNLYLSWKLDQGDIIEILDQTKAGNPERHEVMVNAKIDIFEMVDLNLGFIQNLNKINVILFKKLYREIKQSSG